MFSATQLFKTDNGHYYCSLPTRPTTTTTTNILLLIIRYRATQIHLDPHSVQVLWSLEEAQLAVIAIGLTLLHF